MQRRSFVTGAAGIAAGATAGCLDGIAGAGTGSGSGDGTVLPDPERRIDGAELPYPTWGEPVPDVTLEAPLSGREVAVDEVGKPALFTFFYSHCNTVCPVLISSLRNVQAHAADEGYGDEVAFLPVTFDPERDDAERLGTYAETMNVDLDAGNWHFLRPESEERAQQVVNERFGVAFSRQTGEMDGAGSPGPGATAEDADERSYMFVHTALTVLANGDGVVERAYRAKSPPNQQIIEDLERVLEG